MGVIHDVSEPPAGLGRTTLKRWAPAVRRRSRLTTRLRTGLGYAIAEQGRVVSESSAH